MPRSPYDQKLTEAKQQEQQEIQMQLQQSLTTGGNSSSQIITGHGCVSRGNMDEAASPISPQRDGHSPLRNGALHPHFQVGANYHHGRHKSIERD